DKASGQKYENLLTIEDSADIGDGWFHGVAINDEIHLSSACHSDIALIEQGKYVSAYRIRTTMNLPEEFDYATMKRSEKRIPFVIDTVVRLRAGVKQLEVET